MTLTTSAPPVGRPITLDDGRRAWIRVSKSAASVEAPGHHWHRWVVDAEGRHIAAASYEARDGDVADASVWVARTWRSVGLGGRLSSMLTEAALHHGVQWLVFDASAEDAAAQHLLDDSGWIVARRVRRGAVRAAVRLAQDPRPGAHVAQAHAA